MFLELAIILSCITATVFMAFDKWHFLEWWEAYGPRFLNPQCRLCNVFQFCCLEMIGLQIYGFDWVLLFLPLVMTPLVRLLVR